MFNFWQRIVSHHHDDHAQPATKSDIRHLMATLQEVKDSIDALAIAENNVVNKINELKALIASQQAPAATATDLDAIKSSIDSIASTANAALA
jgi:hypothetical protein